MYKIIEQNGQTNYNVKTYAADSFDELPKSANFGDKAIFNENGQLKLAIYLSNGWVRGE